MQKEVILACDFENKESLNSFLIKFSAEQSLFLKIGMELYYSEGPDIVRELKEYGHKIFLDLKLHDIPNTVYRTMKVLSKMNIDMCNVHAAGGINMMRSAKEGLMENAKNNPLLIAVTQLTSMSQEQMTKDILINEKIEKVISHYAQNAKEAGLSGVVCSAQEAEIIHDVCGKEFITVTPGIRFNDKNEDDQVRVLTPMQARNKGADYIVVGRPITKAEDPRHIYERCVSEFVYGEIFD